MKQNREKKEETIGSMNYEKSMLMQIKDNDCIEQPTNKIQVKKSFVQIATGQQIATRTEHLVVFDQTEIILK